MSISRPRARQRGVALLLFLVLLVLGSLSFLIDMIDQSGIKATRAQATWVTLNQARDALLGYAITYRDTRSGEPVFGYLPCPDINGDGSADALDSMCGGDDDRVVVGLLPFRQLGLADYRDGTGACLWYVVSGTFKASTNKPVPMNWDTQGRLAILDADGNTISAPEDEEGGAVAAIISAGPPLAGQNRTANTCAITDARAVHAAYLDGGYGFPGAPGTTVRLRQGHVGGDANNDQIAWITARDIFRRVKQRPDFAGHLNALIDELVSGLSVNHPMPWNAKSNGPKKVGEVPATLSVTPAWRKYHDNWRDQFRYVLCNDADTPCLMVNGTECVGVLIFAGERSISGPRTTADKGSLSSYLDAENLAAHDDTAAIPPLHIFNGGISVAFADAGAPDFRDVVRCLPKSIK